MIERKDIEELFMRQLEKMTDEMLRWKVVDLWLTVAQKGGWNTLDSLLKMPFTLLTDCHGITFIEHTIAVTEGAYGLAKAMEDAYHAMPHYIDYDRLIAGGLLHDIGKLIEIEPDGEGGYRKTHAGRCARHPIYGAIEAAKAGFPDEIINIIACHAKEGENRPQVIETVLIHQADFATFTPLTMMEKGQLI